MSNGVKHNDTGSTYTRAVAFCSVAHRLSGLMSELWDAIDDCDDPDRLYALHRRLTLGIVNHAKRRESQLRRINRC